MATICGELPTIRGDDYSLKLSSNHLLGVSALGEVNIELFSQDIQLSGK